MSSKIKHYCDRCGEEIAYTTIWDLVFSRKDWIALKYLKPTFDNFEEIELCSKCGKEFELFLKEGKNNE